MIPYSSISFIYLAIKVPSLRTGVPPKIFRCSCCSVWADFYSWIRSSVRCAVISRISSDWTCRIQRFYVSCVNKSPASALWVNISCLPVIFLIIYVCYVSTNYIDVEPVSFSPSIPRASPLKAIELDLVSVCMGCVNMYCKWWASIRELIKVVINNKFRVVFLAIAIPSIVVCLMIEPRASRCTRGICSLDVVRLTPIRRWICPS